MNQIDTTMNRRTFSSVMVGLTAAGFASGAAVVKMFTPQAVAHERVDLDFITALLKRAIKIREGGDVDTGNAMAAKALYYSLCWAPALAEPGTDEYLVQKSEVTKLFREDLTYLTVKNPHSIMPSIYPIYLARYMMSEASIPIVHANLKVNVDGETGAVFHHFTRRYGKIILAS